MGQLAKAARYVESGDLHLALAIINDARRSNDLRAAPSVVMTTDKSSSGQKRRPAGARRRTSNACLYIGYCSEPLDQSLGGCRSNELRSFMGLPASAVMRVVQLHG